MFRFYEGYVLLPSCIPRAPLWLSLLSSRLPRDHAMGLAPPTSAGPLTLLAGGLVTAASFVQPGGLLEYEA
mgnify:CR=1 FL=1